MPAEQTIHFASVGGKNCSELIVVLVVTSRTTAEATLTTTTTTTTTATTIASQISNAGLKIGSILTLATTTLEWLCEPTTNTDNVRARDQT